MATQQTAQVGAGEERPSSETRAPQQMASQQAEPGQTVQPPKSPRVVAAFGTGGGAAIVFSDFASI